MPAQPNICRNCGRPAPRLADGLDSRCYKYRRRTGQLPPAGPLRSEQDESWQLSIRFHKSRRKRMEQASEVGGFGSMGEWIRYLVDTAIAKR